MKRIARVLAACVLILTATLPVHAGLKKLWQRRLLTSVAKESDLPYVWAVSFSPDSSAVAVGMNTRSLTRPRVVLVDPSRKRPDRIIDITTKSAWPDLSWSPDGRYLLVRTERYEKSNEVIEIASGAIVRIDKGECEAWGLIDGPVVVRQCKPTFDRIVIRFTGPDGTELDSLTLDGNVWIEDWNEDRGWRLRRCSGYSTSFTSVGKVSLP